MKKFVIIAVSFVLGTGISAQAQDLGSFLNDVAKKVIGDVTTTENSIIGTWNYAAPAMKLESEDDIASIVGEVASASSVVEDKLEPIYKKIGLDKCVFTFNEDGTYKTEMGKIKTNGTYIFDAETKTITMKSKVGMSVSAKVVTAGPSMTLLFKADKLMSAIKTVTGYVGNINSAASTISSLAKNYDGMSLGFELTAKQ